MFNRVENAEKYIISIVCGNASHKHEAIDNGNSTVYNFANCDMKNGGIEFTVTAVATGYASSTSATYKLERVLDSVTGITVKNDMLTWAPVDHATEYEIKITTGDNTYTVVTTEFSYNLKSLAAGNVAVEIKAYGAGYMTSAAASYTYTKSSIAAPKNLTVNGNVLSWDAVAGENITYVINVDGATYTADTNSIDLDAAGYSVLKGTVAGITVAATDGTATSAASDKLTVVYRDFGGSVNYSKNTVGWTPSLGITGKYEVKVGNNESIITDGASATVVFNAAGVTTISVRFVSDSYTSAWVSTTVDVYSITLDTRLGSGVGTLYFAQGDYVTLPETSTRAGYSFDGWYNTSSNNGKRITSGEFDNIGNVVLFASWKPNEYTITYNVDNGVTGVENGKTITVLFGNKFTLDIPESDTGAFVGWCTGINGTGIQLTDDNGNSLGNYNIVGDTNIYPLFATNVLEYIERDDGTWAVQRGPAIHTVTNVIIPHTYQGKEVTMILENAFKYCSHLLTVSIPNTVEVVGTGAFASCYDLTEINVREIPGVVNPKYSSSDGALIYSDYGTVYLEVFPRGYVGAYTVPETVDTIRNKAFQSANYLTKVTISKNVTYIAEQAFYSCPLLEEVVFVGGGNKALTIEDNAFAGTDVLSSLTLPARLNKISYSTFDAIPKLAAIHVEDGGETFGSIDGILTNGDKDTVYYCPSQKTGAIDFAVGVTTIDEAAFANRTGIISVTIPNYVTKIGKGAFEGCTGIISVEILGGRMNDLKISEKAFNGCTSIEDIIFGGSEIETVGEVSVGNSAFAGCSKVDNLTFKPGSNVTEIGKNAFDGCALITELVIPNTTAVIGDSAFANCANIRTISFEENGVNVEFGEAVFAGCTELRSIHLPSTLLSFDGSVFAGCDYINEIVVDPENPILTSENGVLYDKQKTQLLYYPKGMGVDFATLPESLTTIGSAAFQFNPHLVNITIPANITKIGNNAFDNCVNLKSVTFAGEGNVQIGSAAFQNCRALNTIDLPAITEISPYMFASSGLTSITIPASVTSIGKFAFEFTMLEEITIPAAVATVGEGAFSNTYLTSLTIEDGTTELALGGDEDETGVFSGTSIMNLSLSKRVKSIGAYAFQFVRGFETLEPPEDSILESIGNNAFQYTGITSMKLPKSLKRIGDYAFQGAFNDFFGVYIEGNPMPVTIPSGVTYIGQYAFSNGTITSITVEEGNPEDLLEIADYAFANGRCLTTVNLPARLNKIFNTVTVGKGGIPITTFYTVFDGCDTVEAINVHEDCQEFMTIEGVFYTKNDAGEASDLIYCPRAKKGTVTVPSSVTTVSNLAFHSVNISKVIFEEKENWDGEGTLLIGNSDIGRRDDESWAVFADTDTLTYIKFPAHLKTVRSYAFAWNMSWWSDTTLEIEFNPESSVGFSQRAFYYAATVGSLTLPKVTKIEQEAFSSCYNMTSITMDPESPLTVIGSQAFSMNSIESINIPASVEIISSNAFSACSNLCDIKFEEGSKLHTIESAAFMWTSITEFVIPETVETLGSRVFQGCRSLEKITLSAKMSNLRGNDGQPIFQDMPALKEIIVPEENTKLTVVDGALYDANVTVLMLYPVMREATEFVIPDTVTAIESYAFYGNRLESITLPANLVQIGEYAFENSEALKSIHIPASVTEIGRNAFSFSQGSWMPAPLKTVTFGENSQLTKLGYSVFEGQLELETVILPDSITEMDSSIFAQCSKLKTVHIPTGITKLPDTIFYGCSSLESITLHEGITEIGGAAFLECSSLKTIKIPASVITIIGNDFRGSTFGGCTSLESIEFAEGSQLQSITAGAFNGCTALKTITLPESLVAIEGDLFTGCTSLETVILGGRWTEVPANFFKGMTSIKTVVLPETIVTIGANAFDGCTNLTSVNLPGTIEKIGEAAFRGCTSISSVTIGMNVTEIGNYAFDGCSGLESVTFSADNKMTALGKAYNEECAIFRGTTSLKTINLPDSVKIMGANIFENSGIESVNLPSELLAVSNYAFANCTKLLSVSVPTSVVTIGDFAFSGCTAATSIEIAEGAETIGSGAFLGCTSLASVYVPASVKTMSGNPFISCPNLTLELSENNKNFVMETDPATGAKVLFNKDLSVLVFYLPTNTSETYKVPDTVKAFGSGAFSGSQLVSIEIPSSVKLIPDMLFMYSTKLESVKISASVTEIGTEAFLGCTALKSITIPASVTKIAAHAFQGCSAMTDLTVEDRTAPYTVGEYAFADCTSLVNIKLTDKIVSLAPYMFSNIGVVEYTVPDYITDLNVEGVFANNTKLVSFTFHDGVNPQLGMRFFQNCTALKNVNFGGIQWLGAIEYTGDDWDGDGLITDWEIRGVSGDSPSYAFAGCTALETIDLSKITIFGMYAFADCTSLKNVTFGPELNVLGSYAFAGCTSLTEIDMSMCTENPLCMNMESMTNYGLAMGTFIFDGCTALKTYKSFELHVYEIPDGWFSGCTSLTEVYLNLDVNAFGPASSPFKDLPADAVVVFNYHHEYDGRVYETDITGLFGNASRNGFEWFLESDAKFVDRQGNELLDCFAVRFNDGRIMLFFDDYGYMRPYVTVNTDNTVTVYEYYSNTPEYCTTIGLITADRTIDDSIRSEDAMMSMSDMGVTIEDGVVTFMDGTTLSADGVLTFPDGTVINVVAE